MNGRKDEPPRTTAQTGRRAGGENGEPLERTVEDVVLSRQAVRRFTDRPVRRELLVKLFSLAQRAPSDWNLQPWRWLVLRGAEDRARLHRLAHSRDEILSAPAVVLALAELPAWERAPDYLKEQADAGRMSAAECAEHTECLREFFRDHPERARELAVRNTMLALMTLILVAQSEGLATGFIGVYDEAAIRREFGVPDEWAVAMIVTLGYPAEEPPLSLRKSLAEVVSWDEFGEPRGA